MSENQNRRIDEFAKYDAMTTEELEEILRLDMEAPLEQESDTEMLLYVMEVLANRRKKNASHTGKTALEAYESFKENYMPEVEHTAIVPENKKNANVISLRWFRTLAATAAVLVIIMLGSVTAKAFGWDIWEAVVAWTQETFHISIGDPRGKDNPGNDDILPHTSLKDALDSRNIEADLAPTWIPANYTLTDISIEETPFQRIYIALYQDGTRYLKITVRDYLLSNPEYVEQSEGLVETYEASGVTYYLFSNYEKAKAVWIKDSYECYISGNLSIEELKIMVDSIGKG